MSHCYALCSLQPNLPTYKIEPHHRKVLEAFNLTSVAHPDGKEEIFSSEMFFSAEIEGEERNEDYLYETLQQIVKNSDGEVPWVSLEISYVSDECEPGTLGGRAVFIEEVGISFTSTQEWLAEKLAPHENGEYLRFHRDLSVTNAPLLRELRRARKVSDPSNYGELVNYVLGALANYVPDDLARKVVDLALNGVAK